MTIKKGTYWYQEITLQNSLALYKVVEEANKEGSLLLEAVDDKTRFRYTEELLPNCCVEVPEEDVSFLLLRHLEDE